MHRWKPYHNDKFFWGATALTILIGVLNPAYWIPVE